MWRGHVLNHRDRMTRTGTLLAGICLAALLPGEGAFAQTLRGIDEDPVTRVGRTAADATRNRAPSLRSTAASDGPDRPIAGTLNPATPSGFAEPGQRIRQQTQRRRTGTPVGVAPGAARPADAEVIQPGGTEATRLQATRPRQQNFRSLERPINTAVTAPTGEQLVLQGLTPPPILRRRRAVEQDPYAPLGLRLGTLQVFPTFDITTGYDSNPQRRTATAGQPIKGSPLVRAEAGLTARSDWSVHEINGDLRLGYTKYTSKPDSDRPEGQLRLGGRYDVSKETAFDAEIRGRIDSQSPGSANLTARAEGRPLTYQSGASLGATQRFNRLALSVQGTVDRSDFEDAKLGNGQTLTQSSRNFTQVGMRLRGAYEVTPGVIPFAEALLDTRNYDQSTDTSGFQRNSNGAQLRLGTSYEITRTLTSEIAAGYGLRRFEDQRLGELRGPVVEGALAWTVSPLTTVRLRAATTFDETTIANSSGSVTRRLSAELSHAFLRNLVFTATGAFSRADFNGVNRTDDTLRAALGVDYSLTRNIVLKGSYAHERTTSNVQGSNISSNVFLFGTRLQY
jgi:hypothetical protein